MDGSDTIDVGWIDFDNAADLIAIGGVLSVENLITAYSQGLFPWPSGDESPLTWWCPDPRWVMDLRKPLRINRTMKKVLRKQSFQFSMDQNFDRVIEECSESRSRSWITPNMMSAYKALHRQGLAHSVEVWDWDQMVGGLYGVSLGHIFFGESMFAHRSNASKVGLVVLAQQLIRWGFDMLDCQQRTPVMLSFGAVPFKRSMFLQRLQTALQAPNRQGPWRLDPDLPTP